MPSRPTLLAAVAALLLLAATPAAAQASDCTDDVRLLGFTDQLDGQTFAGTNVGGLSDLSRVGGDRYQALVDNEPGTPARLYDLDVRVRARGVRASVRGITRLTAPDGTPFTGETFDGEGLARLRGGSFLVSSEVEPSIRRFNRSGRQVDELPVPDRFRVSPAGEATRNQTFEGLTLNDRTGRLFTATEGPLSADGTTDDGRGRIRILRYDRGADGSFAPAAQFAYVTESGQGVVELLALSGDELLVLERGFQPGVGNTVRIFRAFLAGAQDVAGEASLGAPTVRPVDKRLVVDLADCPPSGATAGQPQVNPLLDNFEALTFGREVVDGRLTLLLASDDNFNEAQTTRVLALAVDLPADARLEGRAVLPALTFAEGPPSGAAITPANGVVPPFASQPVQGVSAVVRRADGALWAMPDNGYGAKANSADFLLRVYRIDPAFETARGGPGTVSVKGFLSLRDPDREIPFPIVNESTDERLLTGADFDIESFREDADGDLWFGEEFGPFLVHTDATGKVLEAPFPLPGVQSPQNPDLGAAAPTLGASRGFEGTAISPDGATLYPSLEGPLLADPDQRRRIINEFDIEDAAYTGRTWQYRTEAPEHFIGDLTALDRHRLLVIERDNLQGAAARFKRIFLVDLRRTGEDGFLVKRELVNLLRVRNPAGISEPARAGDLGIGDPFAFPFQTIESVLPLGGDRLLVANDNNFPFSAGRNPTRPDDNELIVLRVLGLRR